MFAAVVRAHHSNNMFACTNVSLLQIVCELSELKMSGGRFLQAARCRIATRPILHQT